MGHCGFFDVWFAISAHCALGVHQCVHRQVGPFGNFVVVKVVCACDFHGTGPECHIRIAVGDDRDQAALRLWPHRDFAQRADNRCIAFVVFVHGHRAITKHGFGAGRGDGDIIACLAQGHIAVFVFLDIFVGGSTRERVFEVPHVAVDFNVFNLKIGNRRFKVWVPVYKALATIDFAVVVEFDKHLQHGVVEVAVFFGCGRRGRTGHGKRRAGPVHAVAQTAGLLFDHAAFGRFPVPDFFKEFFAAQFGAFGLSRGGQFLFDHQLGGDACVIQTRLPKGVKPLHAFPTDQDIHQRVVERVTHMQVACDIWRRQHDAISGRAIAGVGPCLKCTGGFPHVIDAGFCGA